MVKVRKIIRNIKFRLGWRFCRNCKQFVKLKWVQDIVMFPSEPPMFCHYECPNCEARSATVPTSITEKAAKDLGHKNFDDFTLKTEKVKQETERIANKSW